ncbi:hypothetical protein BJX65DRAFT_274044 [Aspergillus insuetus]
MVQRRATRACDFCHKRGRRCRPSEDPLVCTTCAEYAVSCTWARTPAKRGTKPRQQSTSWQIDESRHGSRDIIQVLIDNYFESIYPMSVPDLVRNCSFCWL